MAEIEYFIVAESSAIDKDTNRVSILNVLEELRGQDFPIVFQSTIAIAAWNLAASEMDQPFQVTLHMTGPDESRMELGRLNFVGSSRRHRSLFRLMYLPFPAEGEYRIGVDLNGAPCAHHTITVTRGPPSS